MNILNFAKVKRGKGKTIIHKKCIICHFILLCFESFPKGREGLKKKHNLYQHIVNKGFIPPPLLIHVGRF